MKTTAVVPSPEPSTYLLMLTGFMGLGILTWRRRGELA
ncbi:MAG: PEP-CTERM sorting domain-containing protein [Gemmatimonadota bacterium]|nr:PEP-CTERM sorting domain-containing protein [Gemmatimonadota bacterium]